MGQEGGVRINRRRECVHFNSALQSVAVIGAGDLMVNTTVPILKKLINHMEETVNNSSRKNSYAA